METTGIRNRNGTTGISYGNGTTGISYGTKTYICCGDHLHDHNYD